jgi:hypothetical protein
MKMLPANPRRHLRLQRAAEADVPQHPALVASR